MPKFQLAVSRAMQHVESPKEGKWRGLGFGVWGLGLADIHIQTLRDKNREGIHREHRFRLMKSTWIPS